jgi:hypothetical protein
MWVLFAERFSLGKQKMGRTLGYIQEKVAKTTSNRMDCRALDMKEEEIEMSIKQAEMKGK